MFFLPSLYVVWINISRNLYNQAYLLENYVIKCNVIAHQNIIWLLFTKWAAHTHRDTHTFKHKSWLLKNRHTRKMIFWNVKEKLLRIERDTSMLEKDSLTWKYAVRVRLLLLLPQTCFFFFFSSFYFIFFNYCCCLIRLYHFEAKKRGDDQRPLFVT